MEPVFRSLELKRFFELLPRVCSTLNSASRQTERFDPWCWFREFGYAIDDNSELDELMSLAEPLFESDVLKVAASMRARLRESYGRFQVAVDQFDRTNAAENAHGGQAQADLQAIEVRLFQLQRILDDLATTFGHSQAVNISQLQHFGSVLVFDRARGANGRVVRFVLDGCWISDVLESDNYSAPAIVYVRMPPHEENMTKRWWCLSCDQNSEQLDISAIAESTAVENLISEYRAIPTDLVAKFGGYEFDPSAHELPSDVLDHPTYNADTGVLSFAGEAFKEFPEQARRAREVLAKFEEFGWSASIEFKCTARNTAESWVRSIANNDRLKGLLKFGSSAPNNTATITWEVTEAGKQCLARCQEKLRKHGTTDDYYESTGSEFPDDEVPF